MKSFLVMCVVFISNYAVASQSSIDSLKRQLSMLTEDRDYVLTLLALSEAYENEGVVDSSIMMSQKATVRSVASGLQLESAKAYYALAYYQDISGRLSDALSNYNNALIVYQDLDIKEEVAACMNAKGVASYFQGDFKLALEHYLVTLEYVEKHGLTKQEADVLNNIGVIYRVTNKYQEAIDIYYRSLYMYKVQKDSVLMGTAFQNIGVAYSFLGDGAQSIAYLDSSYYIYNALQDQDELGKLYSAYAETYYTTLDDYSQSRKYLKLAENVFLNNTEQEFLGKLYLLWGQVERDDNHLVKANRLFSKGLNLISDVDRSDMLMSYHKEMQIAFEKQGNEREAYRSLKQYLELYKEINASEKLEAIEELQTKYNTSEKEKEILKLGLDNQLSQQRLKYSKRLLYGLLLGFVLVSALLYRLNQTHLKLKVTSGEKDTLLKEIHHRVKNNLQVISSLLSLQSRYIKDDQALDALKQGQDRVASMALIHQDLYQHNNLKGVSTMMYLEELVDNLFESYNIQEDNISLRSDIDDILLDVDTMIPLGLIVNELISNALKHAFEARNEGEISIVFKDYQDALFLSVGDNGKGVVDFENARKSSFGYSLIESFAHKLGADIDVKSTDGLTVSLDIKKFKRAD